MVKGNRFALSFQVEAELLVAATFEHWSVRRRRALAQRAEGAAVGRGLRLIGMTAPALTHRLARREDVPALTRLMDEAISELLKPYLDAAQIAASRLIMGLDTQLIEDGTYFAVEDRGRLAGCGGFGEAEFHAFQLGGDDGSTPGIRPIAFAGGLGAAGHARDQQRRPEALAEEVDRGVDRGAVQLGERGVAEAPAVEVGGAELHPLLEREPDVIGLAVGGAVGRGRREGAGERAELRARAPGGAG